MSEKESYTRHLVEAKRVEFGEANKVLDALRATRAQRGGVGAPLKIPVHLRDAAAGRGIIITDADLDPENQRPLNPRLEAERFKDESSDEVKVIEEGLVDLE